MQAGAEGRGCRSLKEGKSYHMVDVGMQKFSASKYLSHIKMSTNEGVNDLKEMNEHEFVRRRLRTVGMWLLATFLVLFTRQSIAVVSSVIARLRYKTCPC